VRRRLWWSLSKRLWLRGDHGDEQHLHRQALSGSWTSVDWLVLDRDQVVAAEAKFTERGLGQCSCELRNAGMCSERVLERPYWSVASRDVALKRATGRCGPSLAYQGVRNVAAAQTIAGKQRETSFLLMYDARNPYFVGAQAWPGWVRLLSQLMKDSRTPFIALSWQDRCGGSSLTDMLSVGQM
jgi:Restriction Endonuclease associating with ARP